MSNAPNQFFTHTVLRFTWTWICPRISIPLWLPIIIRQWIQKVSFFFLFIDGLHMLFTLTLHIWLSLPVKDWLCPYKAASLGDQLASRFLCNDGRWEITQHMWNYIRNINGKISGLERMVPFFPLWIPWKFHWKQFNKYRRQAINSHFFNKQLHCNSGTGTTVFRQIITVQEFVFKYSSPTTRTKTLYILIDFCQNNNQLYSIWYNTDSSTFKFKSS